MKIRFLQKLIDKLRGKPYAIGDLVRRYEYATRIKDFKTIALGSLHMGCVYRPAPAPEGEAQDLNFGFPYQDLYYSYHFYKFLNSNSTKRVLLSFSVFSPGDVTIKSKSDGICVLYKLIYGIPYQFDNIAEEKKLKQLEKPLLKKIEKYKRKLKNSQNYIYDKPRDAKILDKSPKAIENIKIRAGKHLKINHRPTQMEYLHKLLEATKANSQEFYIILSPVTSFYKSALPPSDVIYAELYKIIDNDKYPNAKIINFYDSEDFTDDDFMDGDHLNSQGAKKFTELLNHLKTDAPFK